MSEINETIRTQLAHRSIRAFQAEPISTVTYETLLDVAQRTASSTGMQSVSVIRIDDRAKRETIARAAGQDYIAQAPLLLLFVLDFYRSGQIAVEAGEKFTAPADYYSFNQALIDAAIMAQNVVVAAESMGLGTVYLGSIVRQPALLKELLELPERTFPVVGLALGYPAAEPQLKPRLPQHMQIFTDRYETFSDYHEELRGYDEEMRGYYDTRDLNRRVDAFTAQVVRRYNGVTLESGHKNIRFLDEQGFTWQKGDDDGEK